MKKVMRPFVIGFRVSKIERKMIIRAAGKMGLPVSDLIRHIIRNAIFGEAAATNASTLP